VKNPTVPSVPSGPPLSLHPLSLVVVVAMVVALPSPDGLCSLTLIVIEEDRYIPLSIYLYIYISIYIYMPCIVYALYCICPALYIMYAILCIVLCIVYTDYMSIHTIHIYIYICICLFVYYEPNPNHFHPSLSTICASLHHKNTLYIIHNTT